MAPIGELNFLQYQFALCDINEICLMRVHSNIWNMKYMKNILAFWRFWEKAPTRIGSILKTLLIFYSKWCRKQQECLLDDSGKDSWGPSKWHLPQCELCWHHWSCGQPQSYWLSLCQLPRWSEHAERKLGINE